GLLGRHGYSRAAAVSGGSKAASWSVPPANMEEACGPKVHPSPSPATATPPSWAGLATIGRWGRRGCLPAAAVTGRRTRAWLVPALRRRPHPQRLSTGASSWSAGLMTTEARERQRYSPAEAVAPILKNSRDHLLHLILR